MSNNEYNPYNEIRKTKRKFRTPSPLQSSVAPKAPRRARTPRRSSSSAQMPQMLAPVATSPVARSPVQIFTSHQAASQAAQQGNIVIPTYIAISNAFLNGFSSNRPVQVRNNSMFGGRRSRKRNNKKRNIKTKKHYQS